MLYFHHHTDDMFPYGLKMLSLILYIYYLFLSTADSPYVLCNPNWKISVAWNLIILMNSSEFGNSSRKTCYLMLQQIFVGTCCKNYEDILARWNLSTLYSRQHHLDAICIIKHITSCFSISHSVIVHMPTRIITDYRTFIVNHNFKVSYSAGCVSAVSVICKVMDMSVEITFVLRTFYNITYN
jgi:hypothetical protein